MKTITLTEEAYDRLASWKDGNLDSFSKVVLAKVPKKGTLADLAAELEKLPPLTEEQAKVMEEAASWANDWRNQRDPWTTRSTRRS
jgi:predicted CopG family antitoxin